MLEVMGLSRNDLRFLMKVSKDQKEREGAGRELLARSSDIDDLREAFISAPSLRGQIVGKLLEILGFPTLVLWKLRIWQLQDPERIARILQ